MSNLGMYKRGVGKSKRTVTGFVGGVQPKAQGKQTAVSRKSQPTVFSNPATKRAAGYTRFVE